jgi:hypothetical protein
VRLAHLNQKENFALENTNQARGMVLFGAFPSLQRLGQARLQQLCDEWVGTSEGRACEISSIEVGDAASEFAIRLRTTGVPLTPLEARFQRFVQGLVAYVVEHGLPAEQAALGRRIIELVSRPFVPEFDAGARAAATRFAASAPGGVASRSDLASLIRRGQAVLGAAPTAPGPRQ